MKLTKIYWVDIKSKTVEVGLRNKKYWQHQQSLHPAAASCILFWLGWAQSRRTNFFYIRTTMYCMCAQIIWWKRMRGPWITDIKEWCKNEYLQDTVRDFRALLGRKKEKNPVGICTKLRTLLAWDPLENEGQQILDTNNQWLFDSGWGCRWDCRVAVNCPGENIWGSTKRYSCSPKNIVHRRDRNKIKAQTPKTAQVIGK